MERAGFEQWKPREVARLLALVETERRYYQEMVATLPVALAVLDSNRVIVSSNRAFRKLANLSGEDLREKKIEQILSSDELIERIRSAHVSHDTAPFMLAIGERRFRLAAVPIQGWDDEMQPETLLMVESAEIETSAAVTAPVPAEPVVEEAAPPLPELVEAPVEAPRIEPREEALEAPAAIWEVDAATFAFTRVRGREIDLLGYTPEHWLTEADFFFSRIHPSDRDDVMAVYRSAIERGGEASAEFRAATASGDSVWVRETVRILSTGETAPRITGVMMPIGERRRIETQAIQAGRIDALRHISSRLAHDLNNPLMIVTGYAEDLLTALQEDDPRRADLKEILTAAGRIAEMAESLSAFTRPLAKAPSAIALNPILSGLEARLREIAKVEVEVSFPDGAVWAQADPDQLEQIVAALATFAAENTAEPSRLTLACRAQRVNERTGTAMLAPGTYSRLDLQIAGRGTGAAQAAFESILPAKDASQKSGAAVTRAYLDIRQWDGDLAFSSDPDRGSTFTVYLPHAEPPYIEPVTEPAFEDTRPPFEVTPEPEPEPEVEPAPVILVVEDEPGIRGLVRKILRREGYEVIEAANAEDAQTASSTYDAPIDLLLTDVMLPGLGGRALAESLTQQHPSLKVVYVSGFTADEGVRSGAFPPGSRFLQKPFTLSALVDTIRAALEP